MELIKDFFLYKYFPSALLALAIIYVYNSYNVEPGITLSEIRLKNKIDSDVISKLQEIMNDSNLTNEFYYLRPTYLDTPSFLVIFLILLFSVYAITSYVYIYSNWDTEKCSDGRFYVAPLYFKDTRQTIKECTEPIIRDSVNTHLRDINNRVRNTEEKVNNMDSNMDSLRKEAAGFDSTTSSRLADATNSLRESVEYAKNSLSTILGALFVNSNMNNETLNTVREIDKTTISNIINDFDDVKIP